MALQVLGRTPNISYLLPRIQHLFCASLLRLNHTKVVRSPCLLKIKTLSFYSSTSRASEPEPTAFQSLFSKKEDGGQRKEDFEYETEEDGDFQESDEEDFEQAEEYNVNGLANKELRRNPLVIDGVNTKGVFSRNVLQLTPKEKKELRAHAHRLGDKLKCHQAVSSSTLTLTSGGPCCSSAVVGRLIEIGKSGVTSSVEISVNDGLEANELLKLKVHRNCPEELDAVASRLEEATRSVVVGQIGRTFILYRPSLRKQKKPAEAKPQQRKQSRRLISKSAGWKNRSAQA